MLAAQLLVLMEFSEQCLRENHAFHPISMSPKWPPFSLFTKHMPFIAIMKVFFQHRTKNTNTQKKNNQWQCAVRTSLTKESKDTTVTTLMIMYWKSFHVSYIFNVIAKHRKAFHLLQYIITPQNGCRIISVNHENEKREKKN